MPNSVVRDKRLSAPALVLLLYRVTFIGSYALNAGSLRNKPLVRGAGLGRDVIERGIKQICDAGYAKRWQPPSTGDRSFGHCVENLTLPPCGASGKAGRVVQRKWFDGRLSVQEMAAYLYLRAGTGKGSGTFARELADRFAWSRPTAAKVIKALIASGLLAKRELRSHCGRMRGIVYETLAPILWRTQPLSRTQAATSQGARFQGTNISNPLHELPAEYPSARTSDIGRYAFRAAREQAPPLNVHDQAYASPILLGWIGSDQLSQAVEMSELGAEVIDAVAGVLPDDKLREFLLLATGKRLAQEILSPPGLYAVRWLAATLVDEEDEDAPGPAEALVAVLNGIWSRIGIRQSAWLNSLSLVGKRMAAEAYGSARYTQFYLEVGEPRFRVTSPAAETTPPPQAGSSTKRSVALDRNLQILFDADGAKTLAPKLLRDPGGLRVFLQKNGGADALGIMANVLRRHMIDGKPIRSVRSWRFFEAAIAEDLHLRNISAEGIRPGDTFGAREWRTGTDA